jgi:hypothetical protein
LLQGFGIDIILLNDVVLHLHLISTKGLLTAKAHCSLRILRAFLRILRAIQAVPEHQATSAYHCTLGVSFSFWRGIAFMKIRHICIAFACCLSLTRLSNKRTRDSCKGKYGVHYVKRGVYVYECRQCNRRFQKTAFYNHIDDCVGTSDAAASATVGGLDLFPNNLDAIFEEAEAAEPTAAESTAAESTAANPP